jgi:hypothetical protein
MTLAILFKIQKKKFCCMEIKLLHYIIVLSIGRDIARYQFHVSDNYWSYNYINIIIELAFFFFLLLYQKPQYHVVYDVADNNRLRAIPIPIAAIQAKH